MTRAEAVGPLRSEWGPYSDTAKRRAYERLLGDVLGLPPAAPADEAWLPLSLFDGDGRCVANVDVAVMPLLVDGRLEAIAGLRSVAVAPTWRGRGLFRQLMVEALAFCERHAEGPTLLYTAEPDLYRRFGFRALPQHMFVGAPPPIRKGGAARLLDVTEPHDRALIARIVGDRTPVSRRVFLSVSPALVLTNLAKDDAPAAAYLSELDTLVAFEDDGADLVIADVVAPAIPPLGVLLGALGRHPPRRVRTLFSPDLLDWRGEPVREDTGLLVRGDVPAAMRRPFMLPPTTEF